VDQGYPSPDSRFVIVTRNDATSLLQAAGSDAPISILDGLLSPVDQVAWTADASYVVLFNSAASRMQQVWITGDQWTAADPVTISGLSDGSTLIGTMSTCRCAVFTAADDVARHFMVVGTDAAVRQVGDFDRSAVAAIDRDDQMYLASTTQVTRIRLSDLVPVPEVVLQDTALKQPIALSVSQAESMVLVLTGDRRVLLYDLQSRAPSGVISLTISGTMLRRLPSPGRYYGLNDPNVSTDALYVLTLGPVNKVFFVPALEP